jgi:serine phosphatase RsbU (regulator of sigma subunit)
VSSNESDRIRDNDKKWESLLRISEEAHSAKSIEEFVATIHEILADLINARNFFIGLYEESTDKYFFPYFEDEYDKIETAGVSFNYDESLEVTLYDLSGTLSDYVRRTGNPVRFPNKEMNKLYDSGEIELFGSQSTSWLGVPLKLSGNSIGVMVVQAYDLAEAYSVKDEELLVFVSDHIARAIERVRVEEKIRKQHLLVLQQKQDITDSINYAKRIQSASLPSPAYIDKILSDYFTIYKPKDIVSGDFYWVKEIDGKIVVVVADSTGHGVPGALMSMLGVTLLNEQFRTFGIRQPGVILGHLRSKVKEILAQEGSVNDQQDGMEMGIVIIDPEKKECQFAGANRPLLLFRKKEPAKDIERIPYPSIENDDYELYTIKGDNQPLGVHWDEQRFTNHVIKLEERDSFYIYSDGFVDQYGGKKRKKFKTRNFRKLLLSVQSESMKNQRKLIVDAFEEWRGSYEQIDDVCVIGVRFAPNRNKRRIVS